MIIQDSTGVFPLPVEMMRLLTTGQAVFETMLYRKKCLWFWERHLARLEKTLSQFNTKFYQTGLKQEILKLLQSRQAKSARIKLCLVLPFDQTSKVLDTDNVLVQIEPVPKKGMDEEYKLSTRLFQATPNNPFLKYKTVNYGQRFSDAGSARADGFNDVLYFDATGSLLETSIANIFAVKDGKIFTPPKDAGVFRGIIRSLLLEKLQAKEQKISRNNLGKYDYFFVTNSIKEIVAVSRIDDVVFKDFNNEFDLLLDKWAEVKEEYKESTNCGKTKL